jgi:hypothetical protein
MSRQPQSKRPKTLDEFLAAVGEASEAVLKAESAAAVKRGFEALNCLASTSCVSDTDGSWDDAGGASFELMRCAVPTRLLQAFKARLHGTAHWERFARDAYLALFHALFRDVLPESPLVHDHPHERGAAASCPKVRPGKALEALADRADKMRREDAKKARHETEKLMKRLWVKM